MSCRVETFEAPRVLEHHIILSPSDMVKLRMVLEMARQMRVCALAVLDLDPGTEPLMEFIQTLLDLTSEET